MGVEEDGCQNFYVQKGVRCRTDRMGLAHGDGAG
jgi:hypothetical protein